LVTKGFNYFVTEFPPVELAADKATQHGFGLFSARFGNIYSGRQLLQLFERAFGAFCPAETVWNRSDGRFVDPFRPQIEPDGFASSEDVIAQRAVHLLAVRQMFENTDLFIFTLGLTEAWESKVDGAILPVAPGVVNKASSFNEYIFINFRASEIVEDLDQFVRRLKSVNHRVRIIFTVSPVPLVATYENRHVLVSTTYSKSALRSAVDDIVIKYDFVDYFPSYEIITGWYNKGRYFEEDLRSVSADGINHVMRLFAAHYLGGDRPTPIETNDGVSEIKARIARASTIICDEELLDPSNCG
jgi:GSCFA family